MAESCPLSVHVERSNGSLLATLKGDIDLSSVDQFRNVLSQSDKGCPIELNMADVTFADSTAVHALLDALGVGHRPRIVQPSHAVAQLLEVTGLFDAFCAPEDSASTRSPTT